MHNWLAHFNVSQKAIPKAFHLFGSKSNGLKMSDDPDRVHSSSGAKLPYTVCVEGNIGCGKSTFLNRCATNPQIEAIFEPIEEWTDVGGVNLLANLYTDPTKWGMCFQTYATLTMLQSHLRSTGAPVKVMERSIFSSRHCFVENMFAEGTLNQVAYEVLQQWYNFIDEYHQVEADLIVYLRTTPAIAYQRLVSRGRNEEAGVTLAFLTRLHHLHETWIEFERTTRGTPTIIIEADRPVAELEWEYSTCIETFISNAC